MGAKQEACDKFRTALNNACGEVSEAAGAMEDIFEGEELKLVSRELGRLMQIIDGQLLDRLNRKLKE